MIRQICFFGIVVLTLAESASAQTQVKPSFEVASIKPSVPLDPKVFDGNVRNVGMSVDKARVDIARMSLGNLIGAAFQVKPYQIIGPDWMDRQRFDIVAKLPDGAPTNQVPEMLQNLLAERFKLVMHHELKDQAVYELVVGKNGPKLKESPPPPPVSEPGPGESVPRPAPPSAKTDSNGAVTITGGPLSGTRTSIGPDGKMHIQANMSMTQLADSLLVLVGRPVIDRTELIGTYQVELVIPLQELQAAARTAGVDLPTGGAGAPSEASEPGASMSSALQDMGLKLQSGKQPLDMIMVDHLEKLPTEQ